MQLVTEPHVYLRCTLGQNGLESSILGSDESTYNNDIVGSNILAKIARTSESFNYSGNQSGEFFVTLQQRKLNSIGLFLELVSIDLNIGYIFSSQSYFF
jgi:hypothetical protein